MNDEQLLRYSRQILLPQVDIQGQRRLLDSCALIIGMGGLGAPVAMYLASAGVGHLILIDDDQVELSNIQRQIIHQTSDVGRDKVDSAKSTLLALNPGLQITTLNYRMTEAELHEHAMIADVMIDASDNFATRFAVNRVAFQTKTALISGAVVRMEGQVTTFLPKIATSPCYRCLYDDEGQQDEDTCSNTGILSPVPGIIGSIQAVEALKQILGLEQGLCGRVLLLDALLMDWRSIKLKQDPSCPVCSGVTIG